MDFPNSTQRPFYVYTYLMLNNKVLPENYIAGLVEGEGCFILQYRREVKRNRPGQPMYFPLVYSLCNSPKKRR